MAYNIISRFRLGLGSTPLDLFSSFASSFFLSLSLSLFSVLFCLSCAQYVLEQFVLDITDAVDISGFVDSSTIGTYPLVYSVGDGGGNLATATRIVQVVA